MYRLSIANDSVLQCVGNALQKKRDSYVLRVPIFGSGGC